MIPIKIIGIAGTNGSGKDSLGQLLAEKGWLFVPATEILRDELKSKGMAVERNNLRNLGNEWRKKFGPGILIDKAKEIYDKGIYKGLAVASIRSVGEAERIHELDGKIVWVDADPRVRYSRIYDRNRGAEDEKTFEQFLEEERVEMEGSNDKTTLNMQGVKAKADIFIENNGSFEEFKAKASNALAEIIKS